MPSFQEAIHTHFDNRIRTLGRIKSRSLGADTLTLTALNVLVYAQLEGGVKDLAACVLRHINNCNMALGDIRPGLLKWRNAADLDRFKNAINFDMVGTTSPFEALLARRVKVRPINRRYELNQMSWDSLKGVYAGLGLDHQDVESSKNEIDQLVDDRNDAAHYGNLPSTAAALVERLVRDNAAVVETVLTDLSLKLLSYFADRLHRR